MSHSTADLHLDTARDPATLRLAGDWTLANLDALRAKIEQLPPLPRETRLVLDGSALAHMDTAGAWLLQRAVARLGRRLDQCWPESFAPALAHMLQAVERLGDQQPPHPHKTNMLVRFFETVGRNTLALWHVTRDFFRFIGRAGTMLGKALRQPRRFRLDAIVRHIEETGIDAMPIIALIAFLIAIVLAYQGMQQLRLFGAEIFTINMVAISVLREMGVLLTAIMIAGRSGSAFTAEIGVMQVNEEVDAMRTIGLDPVEMLVLPRLIALTLVMPLLTLLADLMGLFGGALVSYALLDITLPQYLDVFRHAAKMKDFWVGLVKAPIFGLLIGLIGCLRGMAVSGSAESVGRQTTASVVASIFLVLLADAFFAVLFGRLGF